jgi:hypothetical protein
MYDDGKIRSPRSNAGCHGIKIFICPLNICYLLIGGRMREHLVTLGVIFIIVGVVLTVVTFGIGIICAWPLVVVGLILLLIGAVLPPDGRQVVILPPPEGPRNKRYCTNCGREIPFDANVCPYCGKDFRAK